MGMELLWDHDLYHITCEMKLLRLTIREKTTYRAEYHTGTTCETEYQLLRKSNSQTS